MSVKRLAQLLSMKSTEPDEVAEEAIDALEEQEREIRALQAQISKNLPEDVIERGTLTPVGRETYKMALQAAAACARKLGHNDVAGAILCLRVP